MAEEASAALPTLLTMAQCLSTSRIQDEVAQLQQIAGNTDMDIRIMEGIAVPLVLAKEILQFSKVDMGQHLDRFVADVMQYHHTAPVTVVPPTVTPATTTRLPSETTLMELFKMVSTCSAEKVETFLKLTGSKLYLHLDRAVVHLDMSKATLKAAIKEGGGRAYGCSVRFAEGSVTKGACLDTRTLSDRESDELQAALGNFTEGTDVNDDDNMGPGIIGSPEVVLPVQESAEIARNEPQSPTTSLTFPRDRCSPHAPSVSPVRELAITITTPATITITTPAASPIVPTTTKESEIPQALPVSPVREPARVNTITIATPVASPIVATTTESEIQQALLRPRSVRVNKVKSRAQLHYSTEDAKENPRTAVNIFNVVPRTRNKTNTKTRRKQVLQAIDPEEPTYCTCKKIASGRMVACEAEECPIEWFHFRCMGLKTEPQGNWFCLQCSSKKL